MTSQPFIPNGSESLLIGSWVRRVASAGTGSTPSRRSGMSVDSGRKDILDRSRPFLCNLEKYLRLTQETMFERRVDMRAILPAAAQGLVSGPRIRRRL
ncbi:hypothetical protein [Streptomyces sp. SAJ15]|uniref:hypothetical protein n=1 Tax=Streptomyces sp. SAJ15 TaxID=2011095 RepID=UPI0021B263D9|nr:hypothetical protein [Streptomyces sp. SAJ15]